MENRLSVIPINLMTRGGLLGWARRDRRPLPSGGRGRRFESSLPDHLAVLDLGTRGERRRNIGRLHRTFTGLPNAAAEHLVGRAAA